MNILEVYQYYKNKYENCIWFGNKLVELLDLNFCSCGKKINNFPSAFFSFKHYYLNDRYFTMNLCYFNKENNKFKFIDFYFYTDGLLFIYGECLTREEIRCYLNDLYFPDIFLKNPHKIEEKIQTIKLLK